MKQLILVRGIPGSGKTTLARKILEVELKSHSAKHFEADMFFMKDGVYVFDQTKIKEAHAWCRRMTSYFVEAETVIVSNTFTTKWELEPYFDLAKEHGIVPVVYLAQNQFQNVHNVPDEVLKKMRDRFEYDISSLFDKFKND